MYLPWIPIALTPVASITFASSNVSLSFKIKVTLLLSINKFLFLVAFSLKKYFKKQKLYIKKSYTGNAKCLRETDPQKDPQIKISYGELKRTSEGELKRTSEGELKKISEGELKKILRIYNIYIGTQSYAEHSQRVALNM